MHTPFRWTNCFADVQSNRNGEMALAYLREVIEPSVAALERQIARLAEAPDDPVSIFGVGPAEELLRATLRGFCLSLQALWERQLREYLTGCARDLKAGQRISKKIPGAKWTELDGIFQQLRGVPLKAFDEYRHLNLLQLLGNVCRHGDGPSLQFLATEHAELWPAEAPPEFPPPAPWLPHPQTRTAENLQIPLRLIKVLVDALSAFWGETEYIYKESIDPKHPSLEARLLEERKMRAGRGRPWDPPAC